MVKSDCKMAMIPPGGITPRLYASLGSKVAPVSWAQAGGAHVYPAALIR